MDESRPADQRYPGRWITIKVVEELKLRSKGLPSS